MSHINILASSSTTNGATQVSSGRNEFSIQMGTQPIKIPKSAKKIRLSAKSAGIWNTVLNIDATNNTFKIKDGGVTTTVTVDPGNYSVSGLQSSIDNALVAAGRASGLFNFDTDTATSKIVLRLNIAGVQVDFTVALGMRTILGFNSELVPSGGVTIGLYRQTAENIAQFNAYNSFLIHCSLVSNGIMLNGSSSDIIMQVPINVNPGSLINFIPVNPIILSVDYLAGGNPISRATFRLTDEFNNDINTNGEDWFVLIVIEIEEDETVELLKLVHKDLQELISIMKR